MPQNATAVTSGYELGAAESAGSYLLHCMHHGGFEALSVVIAKVAVSWDIPSCSPYVDQDLRGKYHLHIQGFGNQPSKKPGCSICLATWLYVLPKRRFTYRLQDAMSQKIATFLLHASRFRRQWTSYRTVDTSHLVEQTYSSREEC